MAPTINLSLQAGFTGVIRWDDDKITVTAVGDPTSAAESEPPVDVDAAKVARILANFARHNPDVYRMHSALVERGWEAHPPRPKGDRPNESYVRMQYLGATDDVSVYLNTRYLECAGVRAREFAATLPDAEVRPNRNVYLHFAGRKGANVDAAVAHAVALEAFADKEPDPGRQTA